MCAESYLAQDKLFMEFFDMAKVEMKAQSKTRAAKSRKMRQKGEDLMKDLALSSAEVENIFDLLEEELPELWKTAQESVTSQRKYAPIQNEEDLNCTLIAVQKHGPMTLEEIGKRHHISTVRAKQIVDATLLKLKKTLLRENTI